MPLADLLMERFKVKTRAVENPRAEVNIGITALLILANNPNRLGWIVVNLSANELYLGLTNAVDEHHGIRLNANGGIASMVWDEDFQMTGWAIWAIGSAINTYIYVLEVVEY